MKNTQTDSDCRARADRAEDSRRPGAGTTPCKEYDVIVIGGGATGAGTARDCAMRGLKTILIERLDFTAGATGRNHGLLHSGARYAHTDPESAAECIKEKGYEAFPALKQALVAEINALGIPHLHVEDLHLLLGQYVNLEYSLPSGQKVKLLADDNVYLGAQVEVPGSERCYGVAADDTYLLVCEYGCGGSDPCIVLYRRR